MRKGHTMNFVRHKIFIIGGGYAEKFLDDVHELDIDPRPDLEFQPLTKSRFNEGIMSTMFNNPEFSDVKFMVEDRPFYAHKAILSILSEKYQVMFRVGMKESQN